MGGAMGPVADVEVAPLGDVSVTVTLLASFVFIHISAKHSTVLSGGRRQIHSTSVGCLPEPLKTMWPSLR